MLGLAMLFGVVAVAMWVARWQAFDAAGAVGIDYRTFVEVAHRWAATGSPYQPWQLAGPYIAAPSEFRQPPDVPFLYPPPFALLCAAATVVPWVLWWAVPLGIIGWCVASWRPAPWSWPLLALLLAWPAVPSAVIVGGSTMWATAALAAGLRFGWPAVLVVLKPTLAPLALIGIRSRGWWVVAAGLGVMSLAMLPLWADYLAAMRHVTDASPLYSLGDLPMLALPVIARTAAAPGARRSGR